MMRRAVALSPICRDHVRRRTDERQAVVAGDLGEARVLGQEAVAGVDRVGTADQAGRDDVRDVEVRRRDRSRTHAERLVGVAHVQRAAVGFTEDRDRRDPELVASAVDAQRDLAAVGDQYFAEHALPFDREERLAVFDRLAFGRRRSSPPGRVHGSARGCGSRASRRTPVRGRPRARPLDDGRPHEAHDPDDVGQDRVDRTRRRRLGRRTMQRSTGTAAGAGARRNSTSNSPSRTVSRVRPPSSKAWASGRTRSAIVSSNIESPNFETIGSGPARPHRRATKRSSSEKAIERISGDREPRFVVPRRLSAGFHLAGFVLRRALDAAGIAHQPGRSPMSRSWRRGRAWRTSSKPNAWLRSARARRSRTRSS